MVHADCGLLSVPLPVKSNYKMPTSLAFTLHLSQLVD